MASSRKTQERPIGIDLFAGAGGLSLGFEQAGFDVAAAVEIDPIHCATHEYNFPYSKVICASVTDLTGEDIRRRADLGNKQIDVVFGGAPCQGFSLIGKRTLDDPRNQLASDYVRLVYELQPRYFVFENVKGLTVGKHVKFLKDMIKALKDSGYDVVNPYEVLNAAHYSVPQSRQRLFLVGARRGLPLPVYPEPYNKIVTVEEAIGDLPDANEFPELVDSDTVATEWETTSTYARILRGQQTDESDYSFPRRFDHSLLTSSLRTKHTELSQSRFLATEPGKTEPVSRFRKLDPKGLCNTLRAGTDSARGAFTSPRPIHPALPRVITVREAARLHSYPDWFRFHSTKWHGFRQVGNSVPPMLGRAVARQIAEALRYTPVQPADYINLGAEELLYMDMSRAAKKFGVPVDTIAQRTRKTAKAAEQAEDAEQLTLALQAAITEEANA
ncbi:MULTISPECIES: DNA cytosine methyltransferase [unclassified Marinobacter]|uniref:DNA cytosine methyltransferase n=1 Tax=unclassified Marinobacter TaxID=83889 RepID=UPI00126845FB|nr:MULTISPECIES: DNA cytosine methyltransferase [unclassified Marinobacter]QFS87051.1 Modification methylase HaeIII [Marinobacter sp. THAF197a]QFT50835.1 Modification methylase HaeIII [Marinobacter sp. THAF39]